MAKTIRVYPNPERPAGDHVVGVGEDGAELPAEDAQALIDAGWVVTDKPATPAEEN
jgi:hypothetical protein